MHKKINIFLDTDVLVSSLISEKGAAHLLIFDTPAGINILTSQELISELKIVSKRLSLGTEKSDHLINRLKQTQVESSNSFGKYVQDPGDEFVIKGAASAKVTHLISYNLKHYKRELIKQNLNILVVTPAEFLQYFRSL